MRLHLFAGLRVRNFQAARAWYERLLGEPTFFPHAAEAVWTLAEDRSVYVVEHADGAGNCVVTILMPAWPRSPLGESSRMGGRRTPTACERCFTATPTVTRSGSAARRSRP